MMDYMYFRMFNVCHYKLTIFLCTRWNGRKYTCMKGCIFCYNLLFTDVKTLKIMEQKLAVIFYSDVSVQFKRVLGFLGKIF